MKKLFIAALLFMSPYVSAGGNLIHHGFACQNQHDPDNTTPSSTPLTSNIYFASDDTPNVYNVRITGGIPRTKFRSSLKYRSPEYCIENTESFGMNGMGSTAGVFGDEPPTYLNRKTEVYGQAYASGDLVIVNIHSLLSDERGKIDLSSGLVISSAIKSISITMIFRYNSERNVLILDHIMKGVGSIITSGSTHFNTYLEFLNPPDVNTASSKYVPYASTSEIAYQIDWP